MTALSFIRNPDHVGMRSPWGTVYLEKRLVVSRLVPLLASVMSSTRSPPFGRKLRERRVVGTERGGREGEKKARERFKALMTEMVESERRSLAVRLQDRFAVVTTQ